MVLVTMLDVMAGVYVILNNNVQTGTKIGVCGVLAVITLLTLIF